MSAILTDQDHEAIRMLLDLSFTTAEIPDEVIRRDPFRPSAEREILRLIPDAESKTGTDAENILEAGQLLTAERLAYSVTQLLQQDLENDEGFRFAERDWNAHAEKLRERATGILGEVVSTAVVIKDFFTVVSGGRGK